MWVIGCNIGTSDFGAVRWSISSISILIGERFGAKGNLPNHRVDRQSLGIYLDVPKVSKWVISYNLLTNGVNWGFNPVTSHLLTSWDIQVVGFWWFPPEWMFAVALFWPVEKAQESWVLPGEYVDERQHHGVNKSWKPWWLGLGFNFFCYCHPGTWRFPFLICFCSMMLKPQPFDDICLACCIYFSCIIDFSQVKNPAGFWLASSGFKFTYEKQLWCYCWYTKILFLVGEASNTRDNFFFGIFYDINWRRSFWSTGMKTGEAETTRKHLQPLKFDIHVRIFVHIPFIDIYLFR